MSEHVPQRVVIAGGHGQVALILTQLLIDHGDQVVSLLSNPNHSTELQALGAEPVYIDLEQVKLAELESILEEAGAVVFASGAGESDELVVDRGAAALLADAAEVAGVCRFVQLSDVGAGRPIPADVAEGTAEYLAAKIAAERDLQARTELDWTIVRLGQLSRHEPVGTVTLVESGEGGPAEETSELATISDVATVVLELIESSSATGKTLTLSGGATPILEAIAAVDAAD